MVLDCKVKFKLSKIWSPVALKRIKKEFLNLCKLKPPKEKSSFGDMFIEFINGTEDR